MQASGAIPFSMSAAEITLIDGVTAISAGKYLLATTSGGPPGLAWPACRALSLSPHVSSLEDEVMHFFQRRFTWRASYIVTYFPWRRSQFIASFSTIDFAPTSHHYAADIRPRTPCHAGKAVLFSRCRAAAYASDTGMPWAADGIHYDCLMLGARCRHFLAFEKAVQFLPMSSPRAAISLYIISRSKKPAFRRRAALFDTYTQQPISGIFSPTCRCRHFSAAHKRSDLARPFFAVYYHYISACYHASDDAPRRPLFRRRFRFPQRLAVTARRLTTPWRSLTPFTLFHSRRQPERNTGIEFSAPSCLIYRRASQYWQAHPPATTISELVAHHRYWIYF